MQTASLLNLIIKSLNLFLYQEFKIIITISYVINIKLEIIIKNWQLHVALTVLQWLTQVLQEPVQPGVHSNFPSYNLSICEDSSHSVAFNFILLKLCSGQKTSSKN